jgi:hypothetical protein
MTEAVPGASQAPASSGAPGGNASASAAEPGTNGAPGSESPEERNWKALREDRDYLRDRVRQLETQPNARPAANPNPPANEPAQPRKTLADFGFDEAKYGEYIETQTREAARKAAREEIEAENGRKAAEARRTNFEARATKFAEANPKYHEAVTNPRFVQSDALITEIMESEQGPAIALYLANNLDETARLNRMTPVQVAREVVKLEVKLATAAAAARNQMPNGGDPPPNPPAKLDGSGDAGVKKDPSKMTDDQWWAARQAGKKK